MSTWKEVTERFFGGKPGRILAVGLLYVASTVPSLGEKIQNLPGLDDNKDKKETKTSTPEVIDGDNTALFESIRKQMLEEKSQNAEPAKTVDTYKLNVVLSRAKPEKMTFSDGSVANITYGYVNGSKSEEPIIVSLKRPNDKYRTVVSLSNALNCDKNLKEIVQDLEFTKDHDVTDFYGYSAADKLTIQSNLKKSLEKVGTTLKEINDANKNKQHTRYMIYTENVSHFQMFGEKQNQH